MQWKLLHKSVAALAHSSRQAPTKYPSPWLDSISMCFTFPGWKNVNYTLILPLTVSQTVLWHLHLHCFSSLVGYTGFEERLQMLEMHLHKRFALGKGSENIQRKR